MPGSASGGGGGPDSPHRPPLPDPGGPAGMLRTDVTAGPVRGCAVQRTNVEAARDRRRQPPGRLSRSRTPERGTYLVRHARCPARGTSRSAGPHEAPATTAPYGPWVQANVPDPTHATRATREE